MTFNTLSFRDDEYSVEEDAWKPDPSVAFIFDRTSPQNHQQNGEIEHLNKWLTNYLEKD